MCIITLFGWREIENTQKISELSRFIKNIGKTCFYILAKGKNSRWNISLIKRVYFCVLHPFLGEVKISHQYTKFKLTLLITIAVMLSLHICLYDHHSSYVVTTYMYVWSPYMLCCLCIYLYLISIFIMSSLHICMSDHHSFYVVSSYMYIW